MWRVGYRGTGGASERYRPLSLGLASAAAAAAAAKTDEEVVLLDVGDLIGITDYFLIVSGRNDRQVKAVVEAVERAAKAEGGTLLRSEGRDDARWVLLDYGDLIVHVFDAEARSYYALERLWADASPVALDETLTAPAARR